MPYKLFTYLWQKLGIKNPIQHFTGWMWKDSICLIIKSTYLFIWQVLVSHASNIIFILPFSPKYVIWQKHYNCWEKVTREYCITWYAHNSGSTGISKPISFSLFQYSIHMLSYTYLQYNSSSVMYSKTWPNFNLCYYYW